MAFLVMALPAAAEDLGAAARAFGFACALRPPPEPWKPLADRGVFARIEVGDGDPLARLLSLPIILCAEDGVEARIGDAGTRLGLALTTRAAFRCDPATAFADALVNRSLLPKSRHADLLTCLFEAVGNAVLHGNLGIGSGKDLTPEEFIAQGARIEEGLDDPARSHRAVTLVARTAPGRLTLRIGDEGEGYIPTRDRVTGDIRMGQGLALISKHADACRTEDGGRAMAMEFSLPQPLAGIERCPVLVVEDDIGIQQLLIGSFLESIDVHDIAYAEDGFLGLEAARRRTPDLIVLDYDMPRMNGLEMLRHLKADPVLADIPVIVQTADDSQNRREEMFLAGATDFVQKPLIGSEFCARVRVHLENRLLVQRLQHDLARIAQELEDAAELQRALLPTMADLAALREHYGLTIDFIFEPSSRLGGDFWGLLPINSKVLGLYICDFAGHGVSAAMNTLKLHTLIDRLGPPDPEDPADFLARINAALHDILRARHFATMLFAAIDSEKGVIRYASAASPSPILGRHGEEGTALLDSRGMPLGLCRDAPYQNHEVSLPHGGFMLLLSDALAEASGRDGRMPGQDGVNRFLAKARRRIGLLDALTEFREEEGVTFTDDLTAVWIERLS